MVDSLPAVEKAQPLSIWCHCEGGKEAHLSFHVKDIVRERSGWLAREKALKTKIKEVANEMEKYANKSGGLCCDSEQCEIHAWAEKILFLLE